MLIFTNFFYPFTYTLFNFYGYYDLAGHKKTDTVPYSLVLNNGMIIGFGKISGYNLFSIVVDINGHNTRNVMGKMFSYFTHTTVTHSVPDTTHKEQQQ